MALHRNAIEKLVKVTVEEEARLRKQEILGITSMVFLI